MSAPIIGLCLAVVFALTIFQIKFQVNQLSFLSSIFLKLNYTFIIKCFLLFQDWWDSYIETNEYPTYLSYIPKIMLALIIALLDDVYSIIAVWLNDCGKQFYKKMYFE